MRKDQKAQNQKHADLHNPSQGFLKPDKMPAVEIACISHNDAAEVNRKETIAADRLGEAVSEQNQGNAENRV